MFGWDDKKEEKRRRIRINAELGREAEKIVKFKQTIRDGKEPKRTGRGSDFLSRDGTYIEVKSSKTARLSKLQKSENKKKGKKYETRVQSPFDW